MCDHSKPIVDDGQGNGNNLLIVKPEAPVANGDPVKAVPKENQSMQTSQATARALEAAPLLRHEALENHIGK